VEALILILIEAIAGPAIAAVGAIAALLGSLLSSLFAFVLDVVMALTTGTWRTTTVAPPTQPPQTSSQASPQSASATPASPSTSSNAPTPAPASAAAPGATPPLATTPAPSPRPPRSRPRWVRWLTITAVSVAGLMMATLLVINQWFLDDVARYILARQQARTGITITFDSLSGNLFSGRFQVDGITVQRRDNPAGLIDLTVHRLDLAIDVWHVLKNPLVIDSVTVDGVRGRFERGVPGQEPVKKPLTIAGVAIEEHDGKTSLTIPTSRKQKRQFTITTLQVTNLGVAYADHTRKRPLAVPVTLTTFSSAPLRSSWAVFDVLFRSNATGTIAGKPLRITTSGDDLGRDTQWHIDGLPVDILADQIGGPFALLTAGTADVHVVDHWRRGDDGLVIVMDWSVVLKQVHAEVPATTSKMMALLAKPAVAFINATGERVPLSFRVEIDENRFHGTSSAEAAGLWTVVSDSAAATLAKVLGIETETVKDVRDQAVDKAKSLLDKLRKKD
jgi:hypothetical protein